MAPLEQQIEAAFGFRGNVTLTLRDGSRLEGYLFNRDFAPHAKLKSAPFVEVDLLDGERRRLLVADLASIELTGKDHAAT